MAILLLQLKTVGFLRNSLFMLPYSLVMFWLLDNKYSKVLWTNSSNLYLILLHSLKQLNPAHHQVLLKFPLSRITIPKASSKKESWRDLRSSLNTKSRLQPKTVPHSARQVTRFLSGLQREVRRKAVWFIILHDWCFRLLFIFLCL